MYPWYYGFKNDIKKLNNKTYQSYGTYEKINSNTYRITELPVGVWTENYYEYLNTLICNKKDNNKSKQLLQDYIKKSGLNTVDIDVILNKTIFKNLVRNSDRKTIIEKSLKMSSNIKLTNMHLFDSTGNIKKYTSATEIIDEYYKFRLGMYVKRKKYILKLMENELLLLKWTKKFIVYVIKQKIKVFENGKSKKRSEVLDRIVELKFPKLSKKVENILDSEKTYNYITKLGIFDLTEEDVKKLTDEYDDKTKKYNEYKNVTVENMWLKELLELETAYKKWLKLRTKLDKDNESITNK